MSDDDYSSDSNDEDDVPQTRNINNNNNNKVKTLTLNDNDDDYDSNALQRPDLNGDEDDDYGEDDGEFEGEDSDGESVSPKRKTPSKPGQKPKNQQKPKSRDNDRSLASSSINDSDAGKKKKKKKQLFICLTATKYECMHRVAKKLNFKEVADEEEWCLYWTDTSVSIDRVNQMKRWQKINHFPGMSEICRKDFLTRNMNRMMKLFPKEYSFYPRAWCLPADYADLVNYVRLKKNKTYICKPDSGCQGRGIFITKNPFKDIKPGDNYVAQVYVSRPFTLDGFKFDLRVYVAVTSCDPFRIFVYREGLGRFTTQQYEEPTQNNCKDIFMHLTNYAIQKRSEDFIRDEDTGTKRRISTINKWLKENGYDVDKMWSDIDDVVIKVLISAYPVLKHNYRTCFANHFRGSACFEILGFDILLDKKLKPYVLEVNHSPSFTTDSKLDREIKDALIYDTIMLLNIGVSDKRRCIDEERKRVRERLFLRQGRRETKEELEDIQQQWLILIEKWENKHMGNYRRIYPGPDTEKYDKYFNNSGTLFSETAASKARLEQAKQQMEEIQRKTEKILGSKNYKNNNYNKEVRGESPSRKPIQNPQINKTSRLQSRNSTFQITAAASSSNIQSSQSKRSSGHATLFLTTASSLEQDDIYNHSNFPRTISGNIMKQKLNPIDSNLKVPTPIDTLKPIPIDEIEELERIQALRQRENLIKGMGINEFVHRILFGTPGTVATIPPPLASNSNNNNNNSNHHHHSLPQNIPGYQNLNSTQLNQYFQQQSQEHSITKYISSTSVYNNNNNNLNNSSSKLELKAKTYNPFENQSFSNEKVINGNNLNNNPKLIINNNNGSIINGNTVGSSATNSINKNKGIINVNNNNNSNNNNNNNSNNINSISLSNMSLTKKADPISLSNTANNLINSNNSNNINSNNNNNNNRQSSSQLSTGSTSQLQNQTNFGNYLLTTNAFDANNNNYNNTNDSVQQKKISARLTEVQLQKNDSLNSNNNNILTNYRVRSAQNVAKQRATDHNSWLRERSLFIFSYHVPTVKATVNYQVDNGSTSNTQFRSHSEFRSNSTTRLN